MLTKDAKDKELYKEISSLIAPMGFRLVEASKTEYSGTASLRVLIKKDGQEITTDDLESVYNIIYPRYQISLSRDLELEVSSPGIQRVFKDVLEFGIFTGSVVRVYSVKNSSYIIGRIKDADFEHVVLSDYLIEDRMEKGDCIDIPVADISKAKLEYDWEAKR